MAIPVRVHTVAIMQIVQEDGSRTTLERGGELVHALGRDEDSVLRC